MPTRLLLIFLLNILPFGHLSAQTYAGQVVDNTGKAISRVSVVLHDDGNHTVAYTQTKGDGRFSIANKEQRGTKLTFTVMGYDKKVIPLTSFSPGRPVVLEAKSFELKEVKVRPDKIKERGDTLVYNVFPFKQGQDRSIADVIKRMPGLTVDDDGKIKFEGKAISNFYVEGLDLMGSKYSMASENLQADKVKNVQVIQNHQQVKSLRGMGFSDQVALNITLKDDAKGTWAATAECGLGTETGKDFGQHLLHDTKLMAMFFGKKKQNLSLFKSNNTGKDIAREVQSQTAYSAEAAVPQGLISNLRLGQPSIDPEQTRFNTSFLAATNHLLKTKRDNDLRLQADYLWDRQRPSLHSELSYTDLGGVTITEDSWASSFTNRLNGELMYKINKDKLYLTNQVRGLANFDHAHGHTLLNGRDVVQRTRPRKVFVSEAFHMTRRLSGKNTLSVSSSTAFAHQPEKLLTVLDDTESLAIRTLSSDLNISYAMRRKHLTITYQGGASLLAQQLRVEYGDINSNETYNQYDLFLGPSLNYDNGPLRLNLFARLNQAFRRYEKKSHNRLSFQPTLYAEYDLSKRLIARLTYSYSESSGSLLSIYRTPIFTSYRTQMSYNGELNDMGTHMVNAKLSYKQPVKRLFGGIEGTWLRSNNTTVFQNQEIDDVYLSLPSQFRSHTTFYQCQAFASHALYWGKTTIGANVALNRSDYALLNQNQLENWRMRGFSAKLSVSSQPLHCLSFELSSSAKLNRQSPTTDSEMGRTRLLYYQHHASLYLFPAKKWEIGLRCSVYHSPQKSFSNNALTNLHVSYKTKRAEYTLAANNLFDNTHYTQSIASVYYNSLTRYTLRPREIIAKVSFDL